MKIDKKILAFSARPLGQNGTAGTYLLIEELAKRANLLSCSLPPSEISVRDDFLFEKVFLTHDLKFSDVDIERVIDFKPDIILIFNHVGWWAFAEKARDLFPNAVIFFDAQTPLLVKDCKRRKQVQAKGDQNERNIDYVITFDRNSAVTWIPSLSVPVIEYSLGIQEQFFTNNDCELDPEVKNASLKFVYVGSLSGVRKVTQMVSGFIEYLEVSNRDAELHIFGTGDQVTDLQRLIVESGYENRIKMHGLVSTNELLSKLGSFDWGVAWVPKETFNNSPSLKVLEYTAAGLNVLATNTQAHKRLTVNGCKLELHDDTVESFRNMLLNISNRCLRETSNQKVLGANKEYVRSKHVYDKIVSNELAGLFTTAQRRLNLVIQIKTLGKGKGGAERIATNLANYLSKRHNVTVSFNNGIPAYYLDESIKQWKYNKLIGIDRLLELDKPHLFLAFTFGRDVLDYLRLARKHNIPFGYQECANPNRVVGNNWKFKNKIMDYTRACWERDVVAAVADGVRLVMPGYERSLPSELRHKVVAFPNPYEDYYVKDRGEGDQNLEIVRHAAKKIPILISVNSAKPNKNFDDILTALVELKMKGYEYLFVDVGKKFVADDDYAGPILKKIKCYGLERNMLLNGPTDNISEFMKLADAHILASMSEGCPTVVLEAMADGVPTVGYAEAEGVNLMLTPGVNGILARRTGGADGIAGSIERIILDRRKNKASWKDTCRTELKKYETAIIYQKWDDFLKTCLLNYSRKKMRPDLLTQLELHAETMIDKL